MSYPSPEYEAMKASSQPELAALDELDRLLDALTTAIDFHEGSISGVIVGPGPSAELEDVSAYPTRLYAQLTRLALQIERINDMTGRVRL